jgi:hypothetical protein
VLGVDDEPTLFWWGEGETERMKERVRYDEEMWSKIALVGDLNGPTGRELVTSD